MSQMLTKLRALGLVVVMLAEALGYRCGAPGLSFLSDFGGHGKVSGIITLRADGCPARLLLVPARATAPAPRLTPACEDGRLRQVVDTRELGDGVPYTAVMVDEAGLRSAPVGFTPHNPPVTSVKTLTRGVYVTGGWADTPMDGAYAYIESGGEIPSWVRGIAVVLAWRQLQPSGPGSLDTSRIRAALSYAATHAPGRTLPVVVIIEVGGNATPLWYVQDPADGFAEPLVRYLDGPGGASIGFTPWDTLAGDMFNNATARVAAEFDEHLNLGAIYVGGAGTPRYPEMWYPPITDCDGRYQRDANGDGFLDAGDFDWSSDCTPPDADPLRQAAAWRGTFRAMASQFPRTQLVGMMDVSRLSDDDPLRSSAAMDAILSADGIAGNTRLAVGVTNMSPSTFDPGYLGYTLNDWRKYTSIDLYARQYPEVFRFNEVDPVKFSNLEGSPNAGAYMPPGRFAPATAGLESGTDYRRWLQDVVGYCGDGPEPGNGPFTVTCDAVLVHRTNLDPGFYAHGWVFDPCTLRQAQYETWGVGDPEPCADPADALAPRAGIL
ncbi:hypothetical protein AB0M95_25225 [Sphaerisporangium sp. NPDC051017]|uniref:hypothetical protein n=1 Tax=Sphaerisporangium sp. NPDC051017 TaxID=3154636 RepID=UPI00343625C7